MNKCPLIHNSVQCSADRDTHSLVAQHHPPLSAPSSIYNSSLPPTRTGTFCPSLSCLHGFCHCAHVQLIQGLAVVAVLDSTLPEHFLSSRLTRCLTVLKAGLELPAFFLPQSPTCWELQHAPAFMAPRNIFAFPFSCGMHMCVCVLTCMWVHICMAHVF